MTCRGSVRTTVTSRQQLTLSRLVTGCSCARSGFTLHDRCNARGPSQHHSALNLCLPAELSPIVADFEASQDLVMYGVGLD